MIHFFPIFSKDAARSPFARALADSKVPYRIFAGQINLSYRNRWQLFFIRLPTLALFSLLSAFRSMILSNPRPNAVVLNSDIEVFIFGVMRWILFRHNIAIVLGSFIFTERSSSVINIFRRFYFGRMLCFTDLVIVHSRLEVDRYSQFFSTSGANFQFIPWCTNIEIRDSLLRHKDENSSVEIDFYLVSAGRSGRDYRTLSDATNGLSVEIRIVCDYENILKYMNFHQGIKVLSNCYGLDYIMQIFNARIVIIPLSVEYISAGQMVLVQAMALGKAIIVTKTPTITDYVHDGHDAILVERGNVDAMRNAIIMLLTDASKKSMLEKNALKTYENRLKTEYGVMRLVELISYLKGDPLNRATSE